MVCCSRNLEALQRVFEWAQAEVSSNANGAGSNLLVSDRGLPGLVIGTRHHTQFNPDTGEVRVAATTAAIGMAGS